MQNSTLVDSRVLVNKTSDFCVCTLAFSSVYRALAKKLAKDLEQHSPEVTLIVFTDQPSDFKDHHNVLVFQHKRSGVWCYHERRFAIAKALTLFKSCIYLDADVRLCAPLPQNPQWQPGITAYSCASMVKHIKSRLLDAKQRPRPTIVAKYEFVQKMAQKVELDLETDDLTWINEFLFVVTRDDGREREFLDWWGKLATFSELNGHHKGPAYAIGLAAAKSGFPIRQDPLEGIDFFDDRVEQVKINQGKAGADDKKEYFKAQQKVEQVKASIWKRAIARATKFVSYHYHFLRLRLRTLTSRDFDFYYR